MKLSKSVAAKRDELARKEFCRLLGATEWKYDQQPTYFYQLWESYLSGSKKQYPWDLRKYREQKETDMLMCKLIHSIYLTAAGINFVQLSICWD